MQTTRYSLRESALWAMGIMAYGVVTNILTLSGMLQSGYVFIALRMGLVLLVLWQETNCRHKLAGKLMLVAVALPPLCVPLVFIPRGF